jgi:hypothetical protein
MVQVSFDNCWQPKINPLPTEAKVNRKISICTTCMDRTYDLKTTYIKNIEENIATYPNCEFVLLNYNSSDDMDEWVKNNLMKYIDAGILNYYKTTEPKFYNMSHSRNVAFKLAQGDIVNNVDADNFTGEKFAYLVNMLAELQDSKAVFAKGKRMMHGRIGLYKKEFLELGGYDEDLVGYGFDDHSVMYRAMMSGYKLMWWCGICKMGRIKTPRKEITKNFEQKSWKETERLNKKIVYDKLEAGNLLANVGKHWGKATVLKNFKEIISV